MIHTYPKELKETYWRRGTISVGKITYFLEMTNIIVRLQSKSCIVYVYNPSLDKYMKINK